MPPLVWSIDMDRPLLDDPSLCPKPAEGQGAAPAPKPDAVQGQRPGSVKQDKRKRARRPKNPHQKAVRKIQKKSKKKEKKARASSAKAFLQEAIELKVEDISTSSSHVRKSQASKPLPVVKEEPLAKKVSNSSQSSSYSRSSSSSKAVIVATNVQAAALMKKRFDQIRGQAKSDELFQ